MEEHLDLGGKRAQQVVWNEIKRSLHPFLPVFAEFLVLNAVRVIDVVEHPVNTDLDLSKKLRGPYLLDVKPEVDFCRTRVIRFD